MMLLNRMELGITPKRRKRKPGQFMAMLLVVALLLGMLPVSVFALTDSEQPTEHFAAFQVGETVYIADGLSHESDVAPHISGGRIMVPVAHASRALGADVEWDAETRTVNVINGTDTISMVIGSAELQQNGASLMEMETPAVIYNIGNGLGRTMLPVSRLARILDVDYEWDPVTQTATFYPLVTEVVGPVIFDEEGTHGPEDNPETIDNDVQITADGVILQNVIITGGLTITEGVDDGTVTLNNVAVEGDTLIQGGGTDSIHINGGSYNNIIVQRTPTGAVRIVVTGQNRLNVEVDEEAEEQIVILEGLYDKVIVTAPSVRIITRGETKINELVITGSARNTILETSDDTIIDEVVINGEGTVFEGGKNTVKKISGDHRRSLNDKDGVVVMPPSGGGGSSRSSTPPVVPPPGEFAGGSGTEQDPYQVATAKQLDNVRNHLDKHFVQVADIDLGIAPWNVGEGWEPIGNGDHQFLGTFDGNGNQIENLTIDRLSNRQGLFGHIGVGALVKQVHLESVDISGLDYTGGLSGFVDRAEISTSFTTGVVSGRGGTGGLVGYHDGNGTMDGSIIRSSYSTADVYGSGRVGGLVGNNFNEAQVVDSYATGKVESSEGFVGGLVGVNNSAYVGNSYSMGEVADQSEIGRIGGLVGFMNALGNVENSYWDTETSLQNTSAGGTGYATDVMIKSGNSVSIYTDWDFVNIWQIDSGISYPYLQWQHVSTIPYPPSDFASGTGAWNDPWIIETAQHLDNVRNYLGESNQSRHFKLGNDIDLNQVPWNLNEGWLPIGNWPNEFYGKFDGNGRTINGLTINRGAEEYVGLFGRINQSSIENLILTNVNISGGSKVGSLVGYNNNGVVSQIMAQGTVNGNGDDVGGLIGFNYNQIISDSEVDVTVNAAGYDFIGGMVGRSNRGGILNSSSSGSVAGRYYVGGLIGDNGYGSTVSRSYSVGNVNGTQYVGGLAGMHQYAYGGSIAESYALGEVNGTSHVGGLIGSNQNQSHVIQCFAAGLVTGSSQVGGLIGFLTDSNQISIVENSFWDRQATNQNSSAGLAETYGKTTEEMQTMSLYVDADWDFSSIWGINADENGGYPFLRWQNYDHFVPTFIKMIGEPDEELEETDS